MLGWKLIIFDARNIFLGPQGPTGAIFVPVEIQLVPRFGLRPSPRQMCPCSRKHFSGMFHQEIETFSMDMVEHFCKTTLLLFMLFLNSSLLPKKTGCHAVSVKSVYAIRAARIDKKCLHEVN